jgi:outer membrane protein OmpA-like peptidoglycan-associated protein
MRTTRLLTIGVFAALFSGCAATVPQELVNAREANQRAANGPASQVAPAELHVAKQALAKAEQAFKNDPDSYQTRDLAYVAQRKAELATATASITTEQNNQAQAKEVYQTVQGKIITKTKNDLGETRGALAESERTGDATKQDLHQTRTDLAASERAGDTTAEQLEAERQARVSAETKLAGAMQDLAAVAAVKEEARGMVITLSGGVLFVSGKYALLNTAMTKLNQVAEALKAQGSDKTMVVEGHTDSQGSDSTNQPLSVNRATTVRDYLVSRGVAADKITAVGKGSTQPVTDNKTPENRANNRRVEIIIEREARTSKL